MSIEIKVNHRLGDFLLDVDLLLPDHGISVLFGPSGSGKTSLLRVVAGLEHFANTLVLVEGEVWQDSSRFLPPHQRRVGYVFQEPSLFPHLTVASNIEYGRRRAKHALYDQTEVIDLLGIKDLLSRQPNTLSGGEKQRVAIARALAASPKLLLMDEPLASLDHARRHEILPYLEQMASTFNLPIIYVSHAADEIARIADYLVLLKAGRVLGSGQVKDMLTRTDLPLAKHADAETLVSGLVGEYDAEHEVNYISFADGEFMVPGRRLTKGSPTRVRVAARDVSLALQRPSKTSILNVLPATIVGLEQLGNSQILVSLTLGEELLLARVTKLSANLLELKVGLKVYAQVKSVAVLV